jgi:hypothetical protein
MKILMLLLAVLLTGCATDYYAGRQEQLRLAYEEGKYTLEEYQQKKRDIEAEKILGPGCFIDLEERTKKYGDKQDTQNGMVTG